MTKPSLVDQGVLISVGCFRLLSRDKKVASLARQYCFAALSERNSFTGSRAAARTMTGKGQWRIQLIRQHRFVSLPSRRNLFVDPLTFRHVPAAARRMMRAHIRQAPLVCPTLPPFFNDRVDQHRNVEADQKSPHDAIPLRALASTLARKRRSYLADDEKAARNMSSGQPGAKLISVKLTSPGAPGISNQKDPVRQRSRTSGAVLFPVAVLALVAGYVLSMVSGRSGGSLPASSRGARIDILRSVLGRFDQPLPFEVLQEPSTEIFAAAMLGASPNLG